MTQVKICGITNLKDALVAVDAGADMLGFVFYDRSPRVVRPECAQEIIRVLRASGYAAKCVGVFVNDSLDYIRDIMRITPLDLVQLHGDEPVELTSALAPCAFKALRPRSRQDARLAVERYRVAREHNAPAFLIDAYDAHKFGGTGARADWSIAAQVASEYPILLAVGLNAENVAEAIRAAKPWGVDVSSGVERTPGIKDHSKVRAFIRAAKKEKDDGSIR